MKFFFLLLTAVILSNSIYAADILQWRGNERTGHYDGQKVKLMTSWPEGGPKLLWSFDELGLGYSGPAILGDTLYIVGLNESGEKEVLFALDKSGKKLWELVYGNAWTKSYEFARIVPTILDNKAYLISGMGEVVCVDLGTKKIVWSVDALNKFEGQHREWGYAENPLIVEGKIIFTPGGEKTSMVALDIKTGETVWQTKTLKQKSVHAMPMAFKHKGKTLIVGGLVDRCFGVDAANGDILWVKELVKQGTGAFANEKGWETNISQPIYKDGKVFISSPNNFGCYMLELPEWKGEVKVAWQTADFDMHFGGIILLNGRLYSSVWTNNNKGNWVCYEWETGKKIYDESVPQYSKGSIIEADGLLYCYDENRGNFALVEPSDTFKIISSFRIDKGSGPFWCHPVICDGVLYVRRGKVLMAFDIAARAY